MPRLIWSQASQRDIVGIDEFLNREDPRAAARIARAIRATALRLVEYPSIGRALNEPFRVLGVRATPYLVIYRLQNGNVEIVRIRHGREDWLGHPEAEL